MSKSPLIVEKLTKEYVTGLLDFKKTYIAVNEINFELKKGEILGLLGPNGAGKTTTIQMLLGLLTPTSGKITVFNKDFFKNRTEILQQVSFASGYDKLPTRLTIWENLDIIGRLYGINNIERRNKIKELLDFFGIFHLKDKPTGMLSAGQMTRVLLAKVFLSKPQIILLDEPTATLDPEVAIEVRKFILEQRKQYEVSILFTSHNMNEVTELCDRILMLKNGEIIADDSPAKLAATISVSHLNLLITQGLIKLIEYITKNNIPFIQNNNEISIDIDEHDIATFLTKIARLDIEYSQISIDKPTLEDYFLSKIKTI